MRRAGKQFFHQQAQFEAGKRRAGAGVDARAIDEVGALITFGVIGQRVGEGGFVAVDACPQAGYDRRE